MPGSSHSNCKVCRVRIHKRQRFGLCPKHSAQHNRRLQAERNKIKARKQRALQAQLAAQIQALEEEHVTEVKITRLEEPVTTNSVGRPRKEWTDEAKQEIGLLYEQGLTYEQINAKTGAGNGVISTVVKELGLPRRGMGNRKHPFDPSTGTAGRPLAAVEPEIPEPQRAALEHMLTEPDRSQVPPRLQPKPEPVAPTPSVERRPQPMPEIKVTGRRVVMQRWAISVEGTLFIEAPDIAEALRLAQQHDLRIVAINPA